MKRNCYNPVWNEQIVFTEMFPPLCQRIKIQLKENDSVRFCVGKVSKSNFYIFQVGDSVIGTHFIDLSTISNDGKTGKLIES